MNGIGNAMQDMPPSKLHARPTPMLRNIGRAASVRPHAITERIAVLTEIALAANGPYRSTTKLRHC
jgi:hypothetical protein